MCKKIREEVNNLSHFSLDGYNEMEETYIRYIFRVSKNKLLILISLQISPLLELERMKEGQDKILG